MFCKYCGKEITDQAYVCPNCGAATDNMPKPQSAPARTNDNTVGLIGFIMSFFMPVVGLICSIIGCKRAKEEQLNYEKLSLAGIIISSSYMLLLFILILILRLTN